MADLTEEEKLVWLGFKNPKQSEGQAALEVQRLKDNVGDYSTFQSDLDAYDLSGDGSDQDITDFTQFKTYLEDNGFSSLEADAFIAKIKNNFEDSGSDGSKYDDFEDYVQNDSSSYEELQTQFNSGTGLTSEEQTEDGRSVAGIQVYDQPAVSRDGVDIPAGTVEVYGRRIEFSQSSPIAGSSDISYSNLTISDTSPNRLQTITISADISNNGVASGIAYPQLVIDGGVQKEKSVPVGSGQTETVSFSWAFDSLVSVEVTITSLPSQTVTVLPVGLV